MRYESLNRDKMTQKELRSICADLQIAINWGLDSIVVIMKDDTKVNLIDISDHREYYQRGIETLCGSISNVGTKLNKVN